MHNLRSWLSVYSDEQSEIESVRIAHHAGKPSLHFAASTPSGRRILGLYMFEEKINASIFSTCDLPTGSAPAQQSAELFFESIIGSARKFI